MVDHLPWCGMYFCNPANQTGNNQGRSEAPAVPVLVLKHRPLSRRVPCRLAGALHQLPRDATAVGGRPAAGVRPPPPEAAVPTQSLHPGWELLRWGLLDVGSGTHVKLKAC